MRLGFRLLRLAVATKDIRSVVVRVSCVQELSKPCTITHVPFVVDS